MIRKQRIVFILTCDGVCGKTFETTDFECLTSFMKAKHWDTVKRNLKWYHLCPECKEKIDNEEVDLNE